MHQISVAQPPAPTLDDDDDDVNASRCIRAALSTHRLRRLLRAELC
jgi:hypothetical protein